MSTTERIDRLFEQSGLGNVIGVRKSSTLTTVDRMHFRHALREAPTDSLIEPFRSMKVGMAALPLSGPDAEWNSIEQQLCPMVDRLVTEIISSAKRGGFSLPYGHPDWLWRRIAFATVTLASMEDSDTVMLNLMVIKVARMIEKPGGLGLLEDFVLANGFELAIGEAKPDR